VISIRLPSSIVLINSVAALPMVNDLVNLTAGINCAIVKGAAAKPAATLPPNVVGAAIHLSSGVNP